MLLSLFAFITLALGASAFNFAQVDPSSTSYCKTRYGTKNLTKVPRRTITAKLSTTHTLRYVSYTTKTLTPPAVTRTKIVSKGTAITRTADQ
jgi:hypothetical protein